MAHGCRQRQAVTIHEDAIEKHHGRIERRKYEVFETKDMLRKWPEWQSIRCVVRVTRSRVLMCNTSQKSEEVSYYPANRLLPAPEIGGYIRDHWLIENKLHHVRDRAFLEDETVKRENPFVFAALISFALNILRSKQVQNIKGTLYCNSMQPLKLIESIRDL